MSGTSVSAARGARPLPESVAWPITMADVIAARERIAPYLTPTPLRHYPQLDALIGDGVRLAVKHENHQPTNSFKIRNGLAFMTALDAAERGRGVVAASTGNHGQGIAYGGQLLGVPVTICVPARNNPEKNAAMRALGATVVEEGDDYDAAVETMQRIARDAGRVVAHSTNDRLIIAGAGTMTLELLEQADDVEAIVVAIGGGSQAVGALTVVRGLGRDIPVYGVGATGAPAQHDSWHAGRRLTTGTPRTLAEGVATRATYDLTYDAMRAGLADWVSVTDTEIAAAMRAIMSITHNLVEGAGAMGLAGATKLRDQLAGKRVAIVFCGGNLDSGTLRRVLDGEVGG